MKPRIDSACVLSAGSPVRQGRKAMVFLGLLLCLATTARSQSFWVDRFTIDGGGGTSTGGVYTVSGTIGQPDAGTASGLGYSLTSGFWGVAVVQQIGAPKLSIARTGTNAVISWPNSSVGFVLQVSSSLKPAAWADAPSGTNNPVTVPATGLARFYRLRSSVGP